MPACLYGRNQKISSEQIANAIGRTAEQVERVYRDIDAKRQAAHYLHEPPLLAGDI